MSLSTWWQVVLLHRDIRENRFDEAVFAADLGDVLYNKAPHEYQDAVTFFQKTYLTKGLENLLVNVLQRLNGAKDMPGVIQLQTPFGGGKTHALLALYHLITSGKDIGHEFTVEYILGTAGLSQFPQAKVAVFVGTHADVVYGKTPWGEIAYQLGCYEIIKEHDQRRIAPGKERIYKIFEKSGAALILIDEILEYIVKANRHEKTEKITQGQTLAFLQEISEAVAVCPNTALVFTLPTSALEQYDESAEKVLIQLQKVTGRIETIATPVEGMEIYEVIRKRLFDDLGEEKIRKEVAQWYFMLYQQLGSDVPAEVKETDYREKIERAYPFHPELIDVLYERWGSLSTFQRTRGVLRLLAHVVADLYKRQVPSALIQSCLVNLLNSNIRREFIKHIGNEYDGIIAADIANKNAKAMRIDKNMGSEYEKYNLAQGIATAVFLYSFSGGERKGVTLPWLRVACLREAIERAIIGDGVKKLEEELWHFHAEGKLYVFKNEPNLNRVIIDREETLSEEEVNECLKNQLKKLIGQEFEIYLWPQETRDIPDTRHFKLALLPPAFFYPHRETEIFVKEIYEKAGIGFRIYKNTLFVIALDTSQWSILKKSLKRYLALNQIQKDIELIKTLTPQRIAELKEKIKDTEKSLPFHILSAYRHLAFMSHQGILWRDMGLPVIGRTELITKRIKTFLEEQEKLLRHITPKYILQKAFGNTEAEKGLVEVFEIFLKTPGLPLLENINVLKEAVINGAKTGILGIKIENEIYFKQTVEHIPEETIILKPEIAEQLKQKQLQEKVEKEKPEKVYLEPPPQKTEDGQTPTFFPAPKRLPTTLQFKAGIPWDKLHTIIAGIITPLKDKGAEPEITLEIKAHTSTGLDRTTLDAKIKETLLQIGAKIEEWNEE